jgi:hypothetical protein
MVTEVELTVEADTVDGGTSNVVVLVYVDKSPIPVADIGATL